MLSKTLSRSWKWENETITAQVQAHMKLVKFIFYLNIEAV